MDIEKMLTDYAIEVEGRLEAGMNLDMLSCAKKAEEAKKLKAEIIKAWDAMLTGMEERLPKAEARIAELEKLVAELEALKKWLRDGEEDKSKTCYTCKHTVVEAGIEPCVSCRGYGIRSNWEAKS